jgi:hypothetical protein
MCMERMHYGLVTSVRPLARPSTIRIFQLESYWTDKNGICYLYLFITNNPNLVPMELLDYLQPNKLNFSRNLLPIELLYNLKTKKIKPYHWHYSLAGSKPTLMLFTIELT